MSLREKENRGTTYLENIKIIAISFALSWRNKPDAYIYLTSYMRMTFGCLINFIVEISRFIWNM